MLFIFSTTNASSILYIGVWDNCDFSKPAIDWVNAARRYGGDSGILHLVVGQANIEGRCWVPFPFQSTEYIYSSSNIDLPESYLQAFDNASLKVILDVQPLQANVIQLIDLILSRYSHQCIIGIDVDIEWKKTGIPYHVNNTERDAWMQRIKSYNPDYKLFLTYFKDYTHFPDDATDLVVIYDGQADTQENLMKGYKELASHFSVMGIGTGFISSSPPTATDAQILQAVPHTQYIIHTDDAFVVPEIPFILDSIIFVITLTLMAIAILAVHKFRIRKKLK
jgi:hypothetical protein